MSTQQYSRPDTATPEAGEAGLVNRTKFQAISATTPKIAISSEDMDSELNNLIDAVNELYDTALTGTVPDNSISLAKLTHLTAGSMYYMDASAVPTELAKGTAGQVLTMNSGATEPEWAASTAVPTGVSLSYRGSTAPAGYLLEDGSAVSRSTYSALFSVISTTYGVGDGSTTFNLPDSRGVVDVGLDNLGGTSADVVTDASADTLGGTFGSESGVTGAHTLTEAEIPAHTHTTAGTAATAVSGSGGFYPSGSTTTGSTGGGGSHTHTEDRLQPSLATTKIIKT